MSVRWTLEQSERLKKLWPDTETNEIALILNRSARSCWYKATLLGLKRSDEFIKNQKKMFVDNLLREGVKTRFKKGHEAKNKGFPMNQWMSPEKIEKTKATRFKKGIVPHNTVPIGFERISKDGYIEVKYKEDNCRTNFKLKHHLVYEENFGKIPEGCVVYFLDGNKRNFSPENLKIKSKKQNLLDNQITDSCIVKRLVRDEDLREIVKQSPELIDLKRKSLLLTRKIKENVTGAKN